MTNMVMSFWSSKTYVSQAGARGQIGVGFHGYKSHGWMIFLYNYGLDSYAPNTHNLYNSYMPNSFQYIYIHLYIYIY